MNINKQSKVKEGSKKDEGMTASKIVQFLADVDGGKFDASEVVSKSVKFTEEIKSAKSITDDGGTELTEKLSAFTAAIKAVEDYTPKGAAAFIKDGIVEALKGKLRRKSIGAVLRANLEGLGTLAGEFENKDFDYDTDGKMKKFAEIEKHFTKLRETELKWIKQNIAV